MTVSMFLHRSACNLVSYLMLGHDGKGVLSINVTVNGVDSRSLVLNC